MCRWNLQVHVHWPELCRPRCRSRAGGSAGTSVVHEGHVCHLRASDPIFIPCGSERTDWKVELCADNGRPAKCVSEAYAMDHVAGYCVVDDVSEREFQARRSGQWTKGNGCDNLGPGRTMAGGT